MSSHREAPLISKDPVADSTDVYAFVDPDTPDFVTLVANYVPFEIAPGGPNFYEFGDDVLYEIHVSNRGTAQPDISYQFRFSTTYRDPSTFLYNTGPITSLSDPHWNRVQTYSVTKVTSAGSQVIGTNVPCPPCNIGPLSTPNYARLSDSAVRQMSTGETVFAGQRGDPFHVDLGAVFDLLELRPFQNLHVYPKQPTSPVNALQGLNVHSIVIRVPKRQLTRDGSNPTNVGSPTSVIGVWTSASRQQGRVFDTSATNSSAGYTYSGPFTQVSRLGNPLFNEVLIPITKKDFWNTQVPANDKQFAQYVAKPMVAGLLPALYPNVFPNLARFSGSRSDLEAILLTGIPSGVVPGFQNYTGSTQADMIRLNMAVPPAKNPNTLGLVAGDPAGFPNGRRPFDDTTTVELRAIAGLTLPLVDKSYKPDKAASLVTDGTTNTNPGYLHNFPYLPLPTDGYDAMPVHP